jgi:hypothetical protein
LKFSAVCFFVKKNQKIVSMSADCESDLDKNFAIDEVVRGLVKAGSLMNYDAVQIGH